MEPASLPGCKPGKTAGGGGELERFQARLRRLTIETQPNRIDPDQGTTTLQARAPGKGWSQGTGHPQFKSA